MRILFLAPRFPLPALKGDKLRAWQVLRVLSRKHDVHLVTYTSGADERDRLAEVGEFCEVHAVPFSFVQRASAAASKPGTKTPLQVALFSSAVIRRTVEHLLPLADAVHCNTLRMCGNLPWPCPKPVIVDFIDALSASTYAAATSKPVPARWIYRAEAHRLAAYERGLVEQADRCFAVSSRDAQALGGGVDVAPHGVDTSVFKPPAAPAARAGIVFTGNLGYPPNEAAALECVNEIFPRVKARLPEATLTIAGTRPSKALRATRKEGVNLTGYVEDMAAVLQCAAVALAPMRTGGGVKTKVLEAMAAGAAVVATPEANVGIEAKPEHEILLGETPDRLADQVVRLLTAPELAEAVGDAARGHVEAHFSKEKALAPILDAYSAL
jgi:sugar transferase (PEP-CTERM/EpsH1 system associated)